MHSINGLQNFGQRVQYGRAADPKRLLGIDSSAPQYRVSYGSAPQDEREIAILTRSMLEILLDSKGMFSFLMFLFTLTETNGGQVSPVITVPAG